MFIIKYRISVMYFSSPFYRFKNELWGVMFLFLGSLGGVYWPVVAPPVDFSCVSQGVFLEPCPSFQPIPAKLHPITCGDSTRVGVREDCQHVAFYCWSCRFINTEFMVMYEDVQQCARCVKASRPTVQSFTHVVFINLSSSSIANSGSSFISFTINTLLHVGKAPPEWTLLLLLFF